MVASSAVYDHVDAGAHLRRAVEVQPHLVACDRDRDGDRQHPVDLRIVEHVLEAIGAVRDRGDAGAHLALGIVEQRLAGREHDRGAILGAQRLEALHADAVCRHLRAQVRQALARHLAVQQDEIQHVLLQLARPVEPDRRDAQAFLIDVGMAAIGEVGMMREIDGPGDDAAVDEDRLGEHDVRQMRAAARIGVVADEHVAGAHALDRVLLEDLRHDADEAAEMDRDVLGLAERAPFDIEQGGRAVAPLLDVGRVGRADQRLARFLHDRGQRRADDLDGDRIERERALRLECEVHAVSRIRLR